jgi:RNA polymerase sigma-70 factor (ECF subfamily)
MPRLQPDSYVLGRFPTTQWSRVVTAASCDASEAREALSSLCQAYWYPIYAYVRHRGHAPEQAQDLTQDFFAYILERDLIALADPTRGRFRAFLRTLCARQLADHRDRQNAAKRGGGRSPLPIDPGDAERRYACEPADELTPERIFDRSWALTLLSRVVERLRREYDDAGRSDRLEELLAILTRDPASDSQAEIARRLGTTEGNVRVAVHRLRRRYGLLLREEIAATVGDEAQIDDEIRDLFSALGG